jgi:hypothetical protein
MFTIPPGLAETDLPLFDVVILLSSRNLWSVTVFQETKTDEFDQLLLPKDYSFRAKHRTKFQEKSGGISIVSHTLRQHIFN